MANEVSNEVEQLRKEVDELKKELQERNKSRSIDEYLDELLSDPEINSSFIPDSIEREMYRNTLGCAVALLRRVAQDTSITVLGQTFRIVNTKEVEDK